MNEIHWKSILVRVSVRFELSGVRVMGIRLYENIWRQLWPSDIRSCTKGELLKTRAKT